MTKGFVAADSSGDGALGPESTGDDAALTEYQVGAAPVTRAEFLSHETLLLQIIRHVNAAFWITDLPSRRVIFVSSAVHRLWGLDHAQLVESQRGWIDVIDHTDRDRVEEAFVEAFATTPSTARAYDLEYRIRLPEHRVRWVHDRAFPVRNEAGEVTRAIGIAEDVTTRKLVEFALSESEERFRATFEQAAVGMAHVSADGRWLRVNQRLCEIVGYEREALLRLTTRHLIDTADRWDEHEQVQRLLTVEAATYVAELPFITRDGSRFWANTTVSLVRDDNDTPDYFIWVVEDIRARKQAEAERRDLLEQLLIERERLETVLHQMPSGVIIAEAPSGRLTMGNARVESIFRHQFLAPADIAEYEGYRGFHLDGLPYQPEDWPLARAITAGEHVIGEEITILRGDGTRGTIVVNGAPVRDRQGRIVAGVVTFDDISERVRAADEQRFLAETSAMLGSSLDYTTALGNVAALAVPWIADHCLIHLLDDADILSRVAEAHCEGRPSPIICTGDVGNGPAQPGEIDLGAVVTSGQSQIVRWDLADDGSLPDQDTTQSDQSSRRMAAMSAPLVARGRTLGVLTLVDAGSNREFGAHEVELLEELARRSAVAVDNARLFSAEQVARDTAERATAWTARLLAVTAVLADTLTPEQVADVVVDEGVAALAASAGTVTILEEDQVTLRIVRSRGFSASIVEPWRTFPVSTPIPIAEAARTGQPIVAPSPAAIQEHYPELSATLVHSGIHAVVAVPLTVEGRTLGVLGLSFREARELVDDDLAFLRALGRQAAQAFERARLYSAERTARGIAEAAERFAQRETARVAMLAESSRVFAEAGLDYPRALDAVAHSTAEFTGDCCIVRLLSDDGDWSDVAAIHHADPELLTAVRDLVTVDRQRADQGFSASVLLTGRPLLIPSMSRAAPENDRQRQKWPRLQSLGITTLLIVPLRARDRVFGTLALLRRVPDQPYTAEDQSFLQDVADRAALAIDNARLYQEAQDAVGARDEFLSVAAHELRTPITTIKGYAQMLMREQRRDGTSGDRSSQFLDAIDASTDRLRLLADDLLDVSRLRLGQLPLRVVPVNLATLSHALVGRLQAQYGETHTLMIDVRADPGMVSADPDRTEQILNNLITNAVKYSPKGGAIGITIAPRSGGVLVVVKDEGIGLASTDTERIFEPFHRAANAVRDNLPGLGLGLYICRTIAERHGGRVWARSDGEGTGTAMHLWLPREAIVGD